MSAFNVPPKPDDDSEPRYIPIDDDSERSLGQRPRGASVALRWSPKQWFALVLGLAAIIVVSAIGSKDCHQDSTHTRESK